jgi:hypothetical protein
MVRRRSLLPLVLAAVAGWAPRCTSYFGVPRVARSRRALSTRQWESRLLPGHGGGMGGGIPPSDNGRWWGWGSGGHEGGDSSRWSVLTSLR